MSPEKSDFIGSRGNTKAGNLTFPLLQHFSIFQIKHFIKTMFYIVDLLSEDGRFTAIVPNNWIYKCAEKGTFACWYPNSKQAASLAKKKIQAETNWPRYFIQVRHNFGKILFNSFFKNCCVTYNLQNTLRMPVHILLRRLSIPTSSNLRPMCSWAEEEG